MQVCCGSGEKPEITEEIKQTYPECHLENLEGKKYTAGYTACLQMSFTLQYMIRYDIFVNCNWVESR